MINGGYFKFKNGVYAAYATPTKGVRGLLFICDGLPALPYKDDLIYSFADQGYFVVHLRYKGTWESDGKFLDHAPYKDILDLIPELAKGVKDIWTKGLYKIETTNVVVVGASFGGMTALMTALDARVRRVVAFSPVVDWSSETKNEPLSSLSRYLKNYYRNVYRFSAKDWKKAPKRSWFNPIWSVNRIDPAKVFVAYTKDDQSVPYHSINDFVKQNGCDFFLSAKGGHWSSREYIKRPALRRAINRFLR